MKEKMGIVIRQPIIRLASLLTLMSMSSGANSLAISDSKDDDYDRLLQARKQVNQMNADSMSVEQLNPLKLAHGKTMDPDAYLYIDSYNIRLSKVRIGLGKYKNLRLAILGSSDESNIYSHIYVYNCQDITYTGVIFYTYVGRGETKAYAPEIEWKYAGEGTTQRILSNAICSATMVKDGTGLNMVGYSTMTNKLDWQF